MSDHNDVVIYSYGLITCSVCAPKKYDGDTVADMVNFKSPTGISSEWKISTDLFRETDFYSPIPCEKDLDRQHWLLTC